MKIIILGSDHVGATLAENLSIEENDVTIVDTEIERLRQLQSRLDVRTITGQGSYPSVLEQAGIEDADMLIAVTDDDELNMIACQVAYSLFKTPRKIARIRASEYLAYQELYVNEVLPIDVVISPEQLVTRHIQRLIEFPGALQVLDFAEGKVQLVCICAYHNGPLVGHALRTLQHHMPTVDTRVAAIFRRGAPLIPTGDTVIEENDEVFFIAASHNIRAVMSEFRRFERPYRRVFIVGGGNVGSYLAKLLEKKYQVKLIEHNTERCELIAENLDNAIILQGDASDPELLIQENVEDADVFCAVTNDDEANIMSAMLAKRFGAYQVMALINRPAYVDLMQGGVIDIAISPQHTTVSSLLAHIRRGDVVKVHSLRGGAAEAIEAIAHGDSQSSKVVGRAIEEIDLPPGTTIGAIVRENKVIIAHHSTVIESDDHVILFLIDKKRIHEVERLFQVEVTFL